MQINNVISEDNALQTLVSQLSVCLISKKLKAITVESCTAGWIGKVLTDQSGSSDWFAGGLITYTNQSKIALASVSEKLIQQKGAVSVEVAAAMAQGVHRYFTQCVSVAVSGVAGPGGGSEDKPVGTVCIATCLNNQICTHRFHFSGNRELVRAKTVKQALTMLLQAVSADN